MNIKITLLIVALFVLAAFQILFSAFAKGEATPIVIDESMTRGWLFKNYKRCKDKDGNEAWYKKMKYFKCPVVKKN